MITLNDVAERDRVHRLVDWRQTPKWTRGKLRNQPAEGPDTYEWMVDVPARERAAQVREALLTKKGWSPLIADGVPKPTSWKEARQAALQGRLAKPKKRQVHQDTRVDHGRMLALQETLGPLIEAKLSKSAVAYRTGRSVEDTLCQVLAAIRNPTNSYKVSATIDIKVAYDEVPWNLLDNAIERHLGREVSEDVLELVRSSYRAPVMDRRVRKIHRTRGIPQGSVLGPSLLNLYLTDLDRVVSRSLANHGARCWRYCDDFLIVAKTEEGLREAIGVIERELQRLRLQIKESTLRIRSLTNPQNPTLWLGYAFTQMRTWVPRERIEAKVAALLGQLIGGELSAERLEEVLEAIRTHHSRVLHPDEADRAIASLRRLIAPFTNNQNNKEENEKVRSAEKVKNQVRKPSAWNRPARAGRKEERKITLGHTEGNAGGFIPASSPCGGSTSPRSWKEDVVGVLRLQVKAARRSPVEGSERVPQGTSSVIGVSLAVPEKDQEPTHRDQAIHPGEAIGKIVYVDQVRVGLARVRIVDGSDVRVARFRIRGVRSIEGTTVHAYRATIQRIDGDAVLVVEHPTLAGQLRDGHRVRSPSLMRAWELLLQEIEGRDGSITFSIEERPSRRLNA